MVCPAPDLLYVSGKWQPQGLTANHQNRTALLSQCYWKKASPAQTSPQVTVCEGDVFSMAHLVTELSHLLQVPCLLPEHGDQWNEPSRCDPAGTGEQAGKSTPGKPSRGNMSYWHALHQSNSKLIKTSFCKVLLTCCGFSYQSALDIMQVNTKFPLQHDG